MAWKKRIGCFQVLPALVFESVLIFIVNGECSNGETETAAAVELRRLFLNEMRSSRNDKISIQIQNPATHDDPSAINDPRLDSVDRRLETLDQFVKTQSRLLINKLDTHDQYLRNHVGSLESMIQHLESLQMEIGNSGNYSRETNGMYIKNPSDFPQDCEDIRASGQNKSGIYRIFPKLSGSFSRLVETEVYCDMDSSGNGWLVIQKRMDGAIDFERLWKEYTTGFGNLKGEFWLGNDMLHLLTSNKNYKLRIDMEDLDGENSYAEYKMFSVGPGADKYRITVWGFSGDAGDSLSWHSGMKFSTFDSDNDNNNSTNCAQNFKGGWWFNSCHASNLNGLYLSGNHTSHADGVNWKTFRGYNYSLKMTKMKIAPRG